MSRPKKLIDWHLLDSMLGLNASQDYCCEKLLEGEKAEVSYKSITAMRKRIERSVRERFRCSFVQYRDKKMEPVRLKVFQKQIQVALSGNPTLLIWLGKTLLQQREEQAPVTIINNPSGKSEAALNEIRELLKAKECSSMPTPPLSLAPSQGLLARS